MEKIEKNLRGLFALMLVVFGINKFLQFMPMPPLAEQAGAFMDALVSSGYILPIVGVVELVAGIMIITNKFRALALVIVFPVALNAFLFHLFLDVSGIGGATVLILLNVFLLFRNIKFYDLLLKSN